MSDFINQVVLRLKNEESARIRIADARNRLEALLNSLPKRRKVKVRRQDLVEIRKTLEEEPTEASDD